MIVQTVKWVGGVDGFLELIDQRRLPGGKVVTACKTEETIKTEKAIRPSI